MQRKTLQQVYFNRRMPALLGIGFAAGVPSTYGLLGSSLQAWLGAYGFDIKTIGLMLLVTLPLAFNFVWAPLLDRYRPPVFGKLGRRRGWLVWMQLFLILGIFVLALAGPTNADDSLRPLVVAALFVAFLVASYDVVADAYRTDVLPDQEFGAGAAVYVNGYRVGMLAAGGGALFLSAYMPWRFVYMVLAAMMMLGLVATCIAPKAPGQDARPATLADAVYHPIVEFFERNRFAGVGMVAFAALFKIPDPMAKAMTMPLLQTHLEFDLRHIAIVRDWLGLVILIIGAFVGGGVTARIGVKPSLYLFGVLQAVSNGGFLILAIVGRSLTTLCAVVVVENFCAGMVASGFIAFLMSQCNRRYSATQYAMFTSLMYGSGALIGAGTGYLVDAMGYVSFFALSIVAGVPGMVMLLWVGRITADNRDAVTQ